MEMEVNDALCMNISYNQKYYSIEYLMKKGSVLLFVGWFVSSCGLFHTTHITNVHIPFNYINEQIVLNNNPMVFLIIKLLYSVCQTFLIHGLSSGLTQDLPEWFP
jgi:hypothetical protein